MKDYFKIVFRAEDSSFKDVIIKDRQARLNRAVDDPMPQIDPAIMPTYGRIARNLFMPRSRRQEERTTAEVNYLGTSSTL